MPKKSNSKKTIKKPKQLKLAQRFEAENLVKTASVPGPPKICEGSTKLWKYRPFSRVVRGFKAITIMKNYIQLNEKEVRNEIQYNKLRLRGLTSSE